MTRYYLIQVQADFCPMFYISAKNFKTLLHLCNDKGYVVTVYSSLLIQSLPDAVVSHYLQVYKDVFNTISKSN